MKSLAKLVAGTALLALLGCGNDDPNKNLKPLDPKLPVSKNSSEKSGGADRLPPMPSK